MNVWKVACFWENENEYDRYDNYPTEIGIFSNLPLAALAAVHFAENILKKRRHGYYVAGCRTVISRIYSYEDDTWRGFIEISEYEDDCRYHYACIEISKATLNKPIA